MNANEARQLSEIGQNNNEEFKRYVKYTENDIKRATEIGKRHAVMSRTPSLNESLIKYWENKGFQIKQLFPPQTTLYVTW